MSVLHDPLLSSVIKSDVIFDITQLWNYMPWVYILHFAALSPIFSRWAI
jgi:hypothetical protein